MGLFDHKYSEKEYNKNTTLIKNEITNMMFYTNAYKAGALLNGALIALEKTPFERGDKKVMEAMDKRLFGIVDKMKHDIQAEDYAMFAAHANTLTNTISKSRLYGRELFTPEEIRAKEIVDESRALIEGALLERDSTYKRMKEIEQSVDALDENSTEYMKLDQEYTELDQTLSAIKDNIAVYTRRHNANLDIINTQKIAASYKKLPEQIESAADFARETEKINLAEAKEAGYTDVINETATDFRKERAGIQTSAQPKSKLTGIKEERAREQMESGIGSATVQTNEYISPLKRKKMGGE